MQPTYERFLQFIVSDVVNILEYTNMSGNYSIITRVVRTEGHELISTLEKEEKMLKSPFSKVLDVPYIVGRGDTC